MQSRVSNQQDFHFDPNDEIFTEKSSYAVSLILGPLFAIGFIFGSSFLYQNYEATSQKGSDFYFLLCCLLGCLVMAVALLYQVWKSWGKDLWILSFSEGGVFTKVRPQTSYYWIKEKQKFLFFSTKEIESVSYIEFTAPSSKVTGQIFRYLVFRMSDDAFKIIRDEIEKDRKLLHSKGCLSGDVHLRDLSKILLKESNCIGIDALAVRPIKPWEIADLFKEKYPQYQIDIQKIKITPDELKEYRLFLNQGW